MPGMEQKDIPGTEARRLPLSPAYPNYLALVPKKSRIFTDEVNCVIRYITTNGVIDTFAGTGACATGRRAARP